MQKINKLTLQSITSLKTCFIRHCIQVIAVSLLWASYVQPVSAQDANYVWAKSMGGTGFEEGRAVAADGAGNVYITGQFSGTVDFDPGQGTANLVSAGGSDVFLVKYDAGGNYVWAKNMGGTGGEIGYSLAVDAGGNVYITGQLVGTADFDPGAGTANLVGAGGADAFVAKYNAAGNYLWAKNMGGTGGDIGRSIAVDAGGNVYVTGSFTGTADFDPDAGTVNLVATGGTDIFVAKYDAGGNYVWAKSIGGTGADVGNGVAVDTDGNVHITGNFTGTVDFDPGAGTANLVSAGNDIFIAKFNSGGNYVWAKRIGGNNSDIGYSLAVDVGGNVYVTGSFAGTADFDPGPGTANLVVAGSVDVFVAKYDSGGDYVWARKMGGSAGDESYGLAVDAGGNVYVTGYLTGTADFDPGPGTANLVAAGGTDVFVAKLDVGGNYVWAKSVGGTGAEVGWGLGVDAARNVYVTGYFNGANGDFDPGPGTANLVAVGGFDAFVLKMSQPSCNTFSTLTASACNSYTLNGQSYTATGNYTQTRTNASGCDSIITLVLTINRNSSTISQTACNSFTFSGSTYNTSGVYTATFTNAAGCDSVVTLNLTVNHSSPVTRHTETACNSFAFLGHTYSQSGSYADTFTNAAGCDSIITLDLTVHYASDTILTIQACDSLVLNDSVYTLSGTYAQILPTVSGCDSTITLQLNISSAQATVVQSGTTLTVNSADTYQWLDCDHGFTAVDGATAQVFTPLVTGNYAVAVATDHCNDTSECFSVEIPTYINEPGSRNALQLYPNPTDGRITIKTEKPFILATIRLVSLLGQSLEERAHQAGSLFIMDMAPYATGIYFIEVGEGGKTVRMKVVKK